MSSDFDWNSLNEVVETKKTKYKFSDYQHYFKKVAVDRYKSLNGSNQLWELRAADDGEEYLFALYNEAEDVVTGSDSPKDFQATADKEGESVTLAYQKTPIFRFAKQTYQFPDGADAFADFVEKKAQDKAWVEKLMNEAMTKERREAVLRLIEGV